MGNCRSEGDVVAQGDKFPTNDFKTKTSLEDVLEN
jgi:hypothetical protein